MSELQTKGLFLYSCIYCSTHRQIVLYVFCYFDVFQIHEVVG